MVNASAPRFSSVSDPIADLLTRIRNANLAYKQETYAPVSKAAAAILDILDREGFIDGYERVGEGVGAAFRIRLKYGPRKQRTITGLRRISKPGRRIYRGRDELPRVRGGLGIAIVSTSQGVMTDREAARRRVGGEIVAEVW
ncbi:MAG: 30S ribosomal protein S8 [Actinomycetota bacterium]|jgi:small subunit ribosomal protein S8|nr:MAG: 30S ribosomal protein S8 [Actinomycetota bacterium]